MSRDLSYRTTVTCQVRCVFSHLTATEVGGTRPVTPSHPPQRGRCLAPHPLHHPLVSINVTRVEWAVTYHIVQLLHVRFGVCAPTSLPQRLVALGRSRLRTRHSEGGAWPRIPYATHLAMALVSINVTRGGATSAAPNQFNRKWKEALCIEQHKPFVFLICPLMFYLYCAFDIV
jgi:hypothetical protein